MSEISHSDELVTKQDLSNFYQGILPYLGGMPDMLANKFSKGDLYSTDEKIIGRWIDGKPIYQKTISCGALPNATETKKIAHSISNLGLVIKLYGCAKRNTDGGRFILPNVTDNYQGAVSTLLQIDGTSIYLRNYGNDKSVYTESYVTILYTKTTDSAVEMGNDTDYSTTEKIVGTWIDGKPIYQKTFTATTPSTALSNEDIVTHGLSIGTVVSIKGVVIKTDSTYGKYFWDINSTIGSTSYGGDMRACWVRPNTIAMKVSDGATNLPVIITLQYTKS